MLISTGEVTLSHPFPHRRFQSWEPKHRRNGKIRAREVRVIDETKQQLGVMPLGDALRLAQSRGLDLIEISPNAVPPVCRIVDYGKFQYEEAKRGRESRSRQSASKVKELQLSAGIDPHDFSVKLDHAIRFLCDDIKVHLKLRFRGRQKVHKELGFDLMNKFIKDSAQYGQPDAPPKMLGDRDLNVIISPLPSSKRGKPPRPTVPPPPIQPPSSSDENAD